MDVFLEHVYGRECVSGTRLWGNMWNTFMGVNVFLNTFMGVYGRECVSRLCECFWNTFMGVNVFLEHVYGRECVSGTRLWA